MTIDQDCNPLPGLVLAAGLLCFAGASAAHEGQPGATQAGAMRTTGFGRPGAAGSATRTVVVRLTDAMRFSPDSLRFTRGETVRLRIANVGRLPHEFVLGTKQDIARHAEMMRRMPGMIHKDASSARVAPGKSVDLVWQFSSPGTFYFACLVPGHREAGMQGTVLVGAPARP